MRCHRYRFQLALLIAFILSALSVESATVDVTISGFAFHPQTLTINQGDTVRWTNEDAIGHTATGGTGCTPNGTFDSGLLSQGASFSFQFNQAGDFPYLCKPHCASMQGSITVNAITSSNTPPVVSISSPTNGATFQAGENVTIQAEASDADGTVQSVEFYDGTNSLGIVTTAPYAVTVTNLSAGPHTLTAEAVDNSGDQTVSSAVSISVGGTVIPDPVPVFITKGDLKLELQTVASGLMSPLGMAVPDDGSGRMFVVDQAGMIWLITAAGKAAEPVLDVSSRLVNLGPYDERGLLGIALHPNFAEHPLIYTYTSETNGPAADFPSMMPAGKTNDCQSVLAEWRLDAANTNRIDPASRREILRIDKPQSNHNGGTIAFGSDGFLYLGTGDGGNANDVGDGHMPGGNAQDTSMILGKMIRIDVDTRTSANGQYGIPNDNPFVQSGGLPEIYAYGFRNPYKWSFDRQTGEIYVADVGQNHIEEIDLVTKGGNFGWNIKEGTFFFDPATGNNVTEPYRQPPAGLIDPIAQYGHGEGSAVIGGYVYRGTNIPSLQGRYVFADWGSFNKPSARLFYLDATNTIREFRLGSDDRPTGIWIKGFGQGPDGELYVFASRVLGPSGNTGQMLKIVPVPEPITLAAALDATKTNLSASWAGGEGPFVLQRKSSLSDPLWENASFSAGSEGTASAEGPSGFLRVLETAHTPAVPFTVYMSGAMERPSPIQTAGSGSGTLSLEGNTLSFNISYSGLSGTATAAHIHGPASTADSASVMISLVPFAVGTLGTNGAFSGVTQITDEQKAIILAGKAYVNVHTAANSAGEIRGQIAPLVIQVALDPAKAGTPAGSSSGNGIGLGMLVGNQLTLNVGYRNLTGPAAAAHIHGPALPSGSAGILVDLQPLNGGAFGIGGGFSGTVTLEPQVLANLLDGLTYVNIHTPNFTGGEIRGQLMPQTTAVPLSASLSAAAETSSVSSPGSGIALFALEADRLLFSLSFSNITGVATGAHIHGPASPSTNASILIDLLPFATGPISSNGTLSGVVPLTGQQRAWLLSGQTYVNVHTANHPSGEIRGQIAPSLVSASLSGAQERPNSIKTAASGFGTFVLVGDRLSFNLSYAGLSGIASAAHIHGPAGAFASASVLTDLGPFAGPWGDSGYLAGATQLNATNLINVISGQTYVNVHTPANSAGEIRGQLTQ